MVGKARNDRRHKRSDRHACLCKRLDRRKPACRLGGSWFELARQIAIKRCNRNEYQGRVQLRERGKQIHVASHQLVFRNNDHGISELRKDLQATPRQLKPAFNGLKSIRDAADCDRLRNPFGGGQFLSQKRGRILFHKDLRFKIQSRGKSEIFMIGPGKAIHTTVLAPPRSEEHTSELQSRLHLVCRLLLEKKKKA